MAGIDLTTAQNNLDNWLTIASQLSSAKTVSSGDDSYTRDDLDSINRNIDFWDRKVKMLSRGSGVSVHRMIVND